MKSCKLRSAHYPSAQCIFEDVETADTAMELLQGQRLDPDLDVEIRAEKIEEVLAGACGEQEGGADSVVVGSTAEDDDNAKLLIESDAEDDRLNGNPCTDWVRISPAM